MGQLVQAIIFYSMFAVLLVLIGLSLRESMRRTNRTTQALIDIGMKSAEAAKEAADAAQSIASYLEKRDHAR